MRDERKQRKHALLPDFGSAANMVRFLVVAQAVAIVLALARNRALDAGAWQDFILLTVFALLVALGSIIIIKPIATPIRGLGLATATGIVFVIILLVSAGVYEGLLYAAHTWQLTPERRPDDYLIMLGRILLITAVMAALALHHSVVHHRVQTKSVAQQQDRLQALQSRIRPHFLFNSMNSVASLIRSDPDLAEKALQDLADVFRVLLADARKMVPITVESELARQYLDIEKLRLGDRLQVKWTASNVPRSALIPSLTLQPLIENAVYHGIEPSFAGGTVDIQLWSEGDTLNIMISNPVPEVTNQAQARKGNQIAMNNVSERLNQHFGGRARLQNLEQQGNYHVKIRMPIMRG